MALHYCTVLRPYGTVRPGPTVSWEHRGLAAVSLRLIEVGYMKICEALRSFFLDCAISLKLRRRVACLTYVLYSTLTDNSLSVRTNPHVLYCTWHWYCTELCCMYKYYTVPNREYCAVCLMLPPYRRTAVPLTDSALTYQPPVSGKGQAGQTRPRAGGEGFESCGSPSPLKINLTCSWKQRPYYGSTYSNRVSVHPYSTPYSVLRTLLL
jgi:hypothetical protein